MTHHPPSVSCPPMTSSSNPIRDTRNFMIGGCPRLWQVWYSLLVNTAHIALLYYGLRYRYLLARWQSLDPRYGECWSETPGNLYLGLWLTSACLGPLFLYCAWRRGIIQNTKVQRSLVRSSSGRSSSGQSSRPDTNRKSRGWSKWISMQPRLLPFDCLLHVCHAFLLLWPVPVLAAEQIRNQAIPRELSWTSDVNFLLASDESSLSSSISFEMVYFGLSLVFLMIRLPNLFWHCSRVFSLLFSLLLFLTSCQLIAEYSATNVLVKTSLGLFSLPEWEGKENAEDVYGKALFIPHHPIISGWVIWLLFGCGSALTLVAILLVLEYGMQQCHKFTLLWSGNRHCNSSWACWALLGFCAVSNAIRAPVLYQCWLLRNHHLLMAHERNKLKLPVPTNTILTGAFIVSISVSAVWFLVWFAFSLKTQWNFLEDTDTSLVSRPTSPDAMWTMTSSDGTSAGKRPLLLYSLDPAYSALPTMVTTPGSILTYPCNNSLRRSSSSSEPSKAGPIYHPGTLTRISDDSTGLQSMATSQMFRTDAGLSSEHLIMQQHPNPNTALLSHSALMVGSPDQIYPPEMLVGLNKHCKSPSLASFSLLHQSTPQSPSMAPHLGFGTRPMMLTGGRVTFADPSTEGVPRVPTPRQQHSSDDYRTMVRAVSNDLLLTQPNHQLQRPSPSFPTTFLDDATPMQVYDAPASSTLQRPTTLMAPRLPSSSSSPVSTTAMLLSPLPPAPSPFSQQSSEINRPNGSSGEPLPNNDLCSQV